MKRSSRKSNPKKAPRPQRLDGATSTVEELESRTLLSGMTGRITSAGNMDMWGPTYTFKVTYTSDKRIRPSSIDNSDILVTGPNGYSRLARFVGMVDNLRTIVARYKVSTPRNVWDPSANGVYTFKMMGNQVKDLSERYVPAGILGSFQARLPTFPTTIGQRDFDPGNGATNVKNFGAIPDDGIDDTDAIQSAINSLFMGNGVPIARDPRGGIIFLPKGTYTISRPLIISSSIILRGEGALTILNGVSANATDSVVRMAGLSGHGFVIRAGVENLKIITNVSKGIDASTLDNDGDLVGLRFSNLTISTGGTGIDTRGKDIYQSTVENVTFTNMGSNALAMTWSRPGGNAAINYIHNVVISGLARANFVNDEAMVLLNGDFNVDGLDIGDIGKSILPLKCIKAVALRNLVMRTGSANLPGGVLAKFENGAFQLDWIDNVGPGRTLQFTGAAVTRIEKLKLASSATIANALTIDNASHVTTVSLQSATLTSLTGVDGRRFSTKAIGALDTSRRANVAVVTTLDGPASKLIRYATDFGVVASDDIDDTDALQAAIDSLPTGNGIPGLAGDVGGTVFLPMGRLNLSRPIKLPSGVWLVGQGNGTSLYNSSSARGEAAIVLTSGAAAGYNNGAGIADLALYTDNTAGIRADSGLFNGVYDLTIDSLTISAAGSAIDLRACKIFSTTINNIGAYSPGSNIIFIGDAAGYSADNRIADVHIYGDPRAEFREDTALFAFRGQNVIENIWIETEWANTLPVYVSGRANIFGLWLEPPVEVLPNRIAARFENASNVTIDHLFLTDKLRRLEFINSNVNINYLDIAGYDESLAECVVLDSSSRLTIGSAHAIHDIGMADDPRVTIGGAYNLTSATYDDYTKAISGTNLLQSIGAWTIQWGDNLGVVTGSATIENTASGPRLKIQVTSNPNGRSVAVFINAVVPHTVTGKPAVATWHIDTSNTALVWTRNFGANYQGRTTGSAAVAALPGLLTSNEQIIVVIAGATGTSYLSNVRLVAL